MFNWKEALGVTALCGGGFVLGYYIAKLSRKDKPNGRQPNGRQPTAPVVQPRPAVIPSVEPRPAVIESVEPRPEVIESVEPRPAVIESVEPRPAVIESVEPRPAVIESVEPRPAVIESVEPRPAVIESVEPRPAVIESVEPRPEVIESVEPRPEVIESVEPRPEVIESVEPRPAVIESVEPRPAVIESVEPRPAVIESVEPRPEVIESVEPRPAVIESVEPRPAVIESVEPRPEVILKVEPRPEVIHSVEPRPVVIKSVEPRPEVIHSVEPRPEVIHSVEPRPEVIKSVEPRVAVTQNVEPMAPVVQHEEPTTNIQSIEPTAPVVQHEEATANIAEGDETASSTVHEDESTSSAAQDDVQQDERKDDGPVTTMTPAVQEVKHREEGLTASAGFQEQYEPMEVGSEEEVNYQQDNYLVDPSDEFYCRYDSTWEVSESLAQRRRTRRTSNRQFHRFETIARDMWHYRHDYPDHQDYPGEMQMPNLDFYLGKRPSAPDRVYIDWYHQGYFRKYDRLEREHNFIQWLFPLQEAGVNPDAVELTRKEIVLFRGNEDAKANLLKSYILMLDFYGIQLVSQETGEVRRAPNWQSRFWNLNTHTHNNRRITRILKSLGTLGFSHYQAPLVHFFLQETLVNRQLPCVMDSVLNYFIFAVLDKEMRRSLIHFAFLHYKPRGGFVWCPRKIQEIWSAEWSEGED